MLVFFMVKMIKQLVIKFFISNNLYLGIKHSKMLYEKRNKMLENKDMTSLFVLNNGNHRNIF